MPQELSRRDAIRRLAVGGTAAAAMPLWVESLLALADMHAQHDPSRQPSGNWTPKVFSVRQNETVVALTETIIPETDTPGAKGAAVNEYIDQVLALAKAEERQRFLDGLAWLDSRATNRYQKPFAALAAEQQVELLTPLTDAANASADDKPGVEFFQAARGMTIAGYYTSSVGILQEIGEPETVVFFEFKGCTHPEHQ
jgi:hypothetical protein